jgi:hypothetical protein
MSSGAPPQPSSNGEEDHRAFQTNVRTRKIITAPAAEFLYSLWREAAGFAEFILEKSNNEKLDQSLRRCLIGQVFASWQFGIFLSAVPLRLLFEVEPQTCSIWAV